MASPPLEALRCGAAPVVSRAGALPEVLADAAVFVEDPLDAGEWAEKITGLLRSSDSRKDLLARGLRLLDRYSPAAFKNALERAYVDLG